MGGAVFLSLELLTEYQFEEMASSMEVRSVTMEIALTILGDLATDQGVLLDITEQQILLSLHQSAPLFEVITIKQIVKNVMTGIQSKEMDAQIERLINSGHANTKASVEMSKGK